MCSTVHELKHTKMVIPCPDNHTIQELAEAFLGHFPDHLSPSASFLHTHAHTPFLKHVPWRFFVIPAIPEKLKSYFPRNVRPISVQLPEAGEHLWDLPCLQCGGKSSPRFGGGKQLLQWCFLKWGSNSVPKEILSKMGQKWCPWGGGSSKEDKPWGGGSSREDELERSEVEQLRGLVGSHRGWGRDRHEEV